jgi:hypothetical protein
MENLLELAKLALTFYADQNNYEPTNTHKNGLIYSDNGNQARFVINAIENFEKETLEIDLENELTGMSDTENYIEFLKNIYND